jgi:hypothetical protein
MRNGLRKLALTRAVLRFGRGGEARRRCLHRPPRLTATGGAVAFSCVGRTQGTILSGWEGRLMVRQGTLLIAVAVVGFCAMLLYNHAMGSAWKPLDMPLSVNKGETTIGPFALKSGLKYDLRFYIDPGRDVPYEDCLLGQTGDGLFGNCKGHPLVLDVVWVVRDDRGRTLLSGTTPREGACCGYVGSRVDTTVAYDFSAPRDANAFLQIRYRRNAAALAPLHPYVEIFAHDAAESAGVGQFFIGVLLLVIAGIGVLILLSFGASRYLSIRRAVP